MHSSNIDAAMKYIARDWPVFPVHYPVADGCSCGKPDCRTPGKHPRTQHGFKDATTDEVAITAWWTREPDANIGILTGATSRLMVVDIDSGSGGHTSLTETEADLGRLPVTITAESGGGGLHFYFRHPGGEIRSRSGVRPGIDVKADAGSIVAPPSMHISGQPYRWRAGCAPGEVELAELPAAWVTLIAPPPPAPKVAPAVDAAVLSASEDDRKELALRTMRKLRTEDRTDGSKRLYVAAAIAVRAGLSESEAVETVAQYLSESPTPKQYSPAAIAKRYQDALKSNTLGALLTESPNAASSERPPRRIDPWRAFPMDALPDPMRRVVLTVSACTATDPAFAALATLVTAAGCIGNRCAGILRKGWVEPAILWGVTIAPSGSNKSSPLRLVTRPLLEIHRAELREYAQAILAHDEAAKHYELALAHWKRANQNVDDPSAPPVAPQPPIERRTLVQDITIEKLISIHAVNPLGLLVVFPELSSWVASFNRYSGGKGGDLPTWLAMNDADPIQSDRKTTSSCFVERAAVSIVGTIQPGVLARYFGREERDSGLLARVLLTQPPTQPSVWVDHDLDDEVMAAWRKLLEGLQAIPVAYDEGQPRPNYLRLAAAAKPVFKRWHDLHVHQVDDTEDDDLRAHLSKLKGHCARFALLFACVEAVSAGRHPGVIDPDALQRAIAVTEWFKYEARRIYGRFAETDVERRRRELIQKIAAMGGDVSVRDLTHVLNRFHRDSARAELALNALAEAGVGDWRHPKPGPKGGKPSKRFRLRSEYVTPVHGGASGGIGCGGDGDDDESGHVNNNEQAVDVRPGDHTDEDDEVVI